VHVVVAGDSLWTIARALQPEGDVRPLVQQLTELRHGRPLQLGEKIVLPSPREAVSTQQ
jgi:LysM repeat protein